LSDVIGSWKIIEISLPRIVRISASLSASRSRSPKRIEPPTMRPGGQAISRRIDIAVTLLPQPDSPTTARVSPASTWIDTPSTARVMPSRVKNQVFRSWISSSAPGFGELGLPESGIYSFRARRGSSASRRPSPSRLTASTVIDRNTAGKKMM
jgi:hypothetical protein